MPLTKSVICPVLIGRADDLAIIEQQMEQTVQGQGQIILVSGEAGVGKTRLISESITIAKQLGLKTIEVDCFETDHDLPFAPFRDILRTFNANQFGESLAALFGGALNDHIILHPKGVEKNQPAPVTNFKLDKDKYLLFRVLAQTLIDESAGSRLIVVEDIHWSDDTSLEFLLYLIRRMRSQRIMLMLTYRSDEINSALAHFLAELDRQRLATELVLEGLSAENVNAMLRSIFDLKRPVRSEFIKALHLLTKGNPFFIEEILKSLIETREIFYTNGTWDRKPIEELHIPRSVQDAVRRRTERLSVAARELLSIVAVVGQRFDFSFTMGLTARKEAELISLVKELLTAQLIIEESPDRFAFRHALTRETVYSELLERERKTLHKKIGECLESLGQETINEQVASLAYHFYQAESWKKAMEYSLLAGKKAQALYTPRATIEHFTHVMVSAQHLSLPIPADLFISRGSAYERMGDFDNACADFEAARNVAHLSQDYRLEWQSLVDLGALWAERDYSKTRYYYESAHALASDINDFALLAHTLNRLGNWKVNIEQPEDGIQYHQQALKLFQTLEDHKGLAETLDLLGMANYIKGDLVQSENYYMQAVEIFHALDDREGLASTPVSMLLNNGHLQSGMAVLAGTDRGIAQLACEEALRISREIGWRSGEAYALIILGNFFDLKGKYGQAIHQLQTSLVIVEEIGHSQWTVYSHFCMGILYLDIMEFPLAKEHLESALRIAKSIGSRWWITNISGYLASTYIAEKNYQKAESVLRTAIHVPSETLLRTGKGFQATTLGQRRCWFAMAELFLSRQDCVTALQIIDDLVASSANLTNGRVIPSLWLLRGKTLITLKRYTEAETALTSAQKDAELEGEKPLLWRILVSLGNLYQLQSRRADSSKSINAARKIIEEIAMEILEVGLREKFLRRIIASLPQLRLPTDRQKIKLEYGGLTAREREVALMITQGKTNRDAADSLFVSERTVETHIENIMSKLGFSSRTQIAAWAVEKGFFKESSS